MILIKDSKKSLKFLSLYYNIKFIEHFKQKIFTNINLIKKKNSFLFLTLKKKCDYILSGCKFGTFSFTVLCITF